MVFKLHNVKKLSKDQLSLITMSEWMSMCKQKIIQEVHKMYDGNILNNFVPMLGDRIMIKKTWEDEYEYGMLLLSLDCDCYCYHWTVTEEMMY